jgi:hypothetical protein
MMQSLGFAELVWGESFIVGCGFGTLKLRGSRKSQDYRIP